MFEATGSAAPVEQQLFDATANAKIWTSRVAMHLDRAIRDRYFTQLDRLHTYEEWYDGDSPVALESYKSLIRSVLALGIRKSPSLALMPSGNLLAMWGAATDSLTIEFLPGDRAKFLVKRQIAGKLEKVSGETQIERLNIVLAPHAVDRWFVGS